MKINQSQVSKTVKSFASSAKVVLSKTGELAKRLFSIASRDNRRTQPELKFKEVC